MIRLLGRSAFEQGGPLSPQVFHGLLDSLRHALLRGGQVVAGVVGLLVAHFTVDLEHPVVVPEHVLDDRPGESVLGVRIEVHFDHPVVERLADFRQRGSGAAVKHQRKACAGAMRLDHRVLTVFQDGGLELHGPRLVDPVYVSEGGGEEIARAFDRVEAASHLEHVLRSREELGGHVAALDPVFFPAHDTGLDLEHDLALVAALQQLDGDVEVVLERQGAAVEHVAVEEVRQPLGPAPLGLIDQRPHERVQLVRLAVIGVQGHVNGVARGDAMHVLGNGDGPQGHVFHRSAGGERPAPGRHLHDPVAFGFGQALQHGAGAGHGGDIDGGIRMLSRQGAVDHSAIGRIVGNRHGGLLPLWEISSRPANNRPSVLACPSLISNHGHRQASREDR